MSAHSLKVRAMFSSAQSAATLFHPNSPKPMGMGNALSAASIHLKSGHLFSLTPKSRSAPHVSI